MTKFVMPKEIDSRAIYIICPDTRCTGFSKSVMRCYRKEDGCPRQDEAKLVTMCSCGKPIEEKITTSRWTHSTCTCGGVSFTKIGATTTYRIPCRKYEQFKRLKIV